MMKSFGFKSLASLIFALSITLSVNAQDTTQTANAKASAGGAAVPALSASSTPVELARAALAAQGGDKYSTLKSIVLRGSVDLYPPNSTQSLPGGFIMVIAGEKVRLEINAPPPVGGFKQIYDGQRSYSSLPGVEVPPPSKFGLPLLNKFEQPGYKLTAIPDKKKLRGFRIADADGNVTDFYVDLATGRVMTYLIPYNGYTFGVDNKKFKDVDGVLVATSFTQRLEMPQGAFFADYNVKDVKINNPIGDDVFEMPN